MKQDVTTSEIIDREYQAGFVTDIESEGIPAGLSEDVVRLISTKKNEPQWLLDWRLKAYRHWLTMTEPSWQNVHYPRSETRACCYTTAPRQRRKGRLSMRPQGSTPSKEVPSESTPIATPIS